jgi:hypothetical protein
MSNKTRVSAIFLLTGLTLPVVYFSWFNGRRIRLYASVWLKRIISDISNSQTKQPD